MANLPAEITHLLEEVTAKDNEIEVLRSSITSRDKAIQNWVRANGGHVKNPKEEGLAKVILTNYDRIEILQAEKVALSEKAMIVVRFVPCFYHSAQAWLIPSYSLIDKSSVMILRCAN